MITELPIQAAIENQVFLVVGGLAAVMEEAKSAVRRVREEIGQKAG
jgi:hypothetical protein